MYQFKTDEMRVPAKIWSTEGEIEEGCLQQVRNLAALPFAHHHVVLNPDGHLGYGMPVGGVLAAKGYIVPNAVGVDISCGMIARRTNLHAEQLQEPHKSGGTVIQNVLGQIMRAVPVGMPPGGVHKEPQPLGDELSALLYPVETGPPGIVKALGVAPYQLGTLGSGNHFIELQVDESNQVWVMLHSGSRALGKAVCDHFNKQADELNERYFSVVPKKWELAFLPIDDELGRQYLTWLDICLKYGELNRQRMVERVTNALASVTPDIEIEETIQTHHNYAALENHFSANVWVHRKGACRARAGELVIIPGSMETGSYIARGLGNAESLQSCSHGAGRRMSRTAARKVRTVQDMVESMKAKGIALATHKVGSVLDEAGHAYKNVDDVMALQQDLVAPVHKLRPLGVVKG